MLQDHAIFATINPRHMWWQLPIGIVAWMAFLIFIPHAPLMWILIATAGVLLITAITSIHQSGLSIAGFSEEELQCDTHHEALVLHDRHLDSNDMPIEEDFDWDQSLYRRYLMKIGSCILIVAAATGFVRYAISAEQIHTIALSVVFAITGVFAAFFNLKDVWLIEHDSQPVDTFTAFRHYNQTAFRVTLLLSTGAFLF